MLNLLALTSEHTNRTIQSSSILLENNWNFLKDLKSQVYLKTGAQMKDFMILRRINQTWY